MSTWKEWFDEIVRWSAKNPWDFIYYVFLFLSPFFLASIILSWTIGKQIEAEEHRKNKKTEKISNMAKIAETIASMPFFCMAFFFMLIVVMIYFIMSTWKEWFDEILKYAAKNPWDFIYYVLLGLSPFFLASTILSWRLAKSIEAEEHRKNKKSKKNANMAVIRRSNRD